MGKDIRDRMKRGQKKGQTGQFWKLEVSPMWLQQRKTKETQRNIARMEKTLSVGNGNPLKHSRQQSYRANGKEAKEPLISMSNWEASF